MNIPDVAVDNFSVNITLNCDVLQSSETVNYHTQNNQIGLQDKLNPTLQIAITLCCQNINEKQVTRDLLNRVNQEKSSNSSGTNCIVRVRGLSQVTVSVDCLDIIKPLFICLQRDFMMATVWRMEDLHTRPWLGPSSYPPHIFFYAKKQNAHKQLIRKPL